MRWIAICLSLLAAVALAYGAQFQNSAVVKIGKGEEQSHGAGLKQLMTLIRKPRWLTGTSLLFAGALLQIAAISLAPLIVVQPLGGIALVITSLANARATKNKLNGPTWLAITLCTLGIGIFVTVASSVAEDTKLEESNLIAILQVLAVIFVVFGVLFYLFGRKLKALAYITGAGILYGFVASLIKAVVQRVIQGEFTFLTFICVVVLGLSLLLGSWFVQNAYSSGPPDLVIAGLTVIDPMVAVLVGVIILNEAAGAPALSLIAFVLSGALAVIGVYLLSRVHPELRND